MSLSAQQVEEFFEAGFIVVRDVWKPQEVDEMKAAFWRLYEDAQKLKTTQMHKGASFVLNDKGSYVAVARVVWCGAAEPILLKYGGDSRLVTMASQILGAEEMDQLINQAHFKMPSDGVGFPWHQDYQHRDKNPGDWRDVNGRGSYVQTLTVLDDMTHENGPVLFIPGTGKIGRVDRLKSLDYSGTEYQEFISKTDIFDVSKAVPAIAPAGSVVFFGPYTIHGSYPNNSKSTRFTLINGYAYPGANSRVYPGEGSGRRIRVPRPT